MTAHSLVLVVAFVLASVLIVLAVAHRISLELLLWWLGIVLLVAAVWADWLAAVEAFLAIVGLGVVVALVLGLSRRLVEHGVRCDERGAAVLELVLLVPVFLVMVFVAVGLGRLGLARQNIDAAASDAARAGSIARSPAEATAAAQAAASDALASHHLTCGGLGVQVDTAAFRPGGWVRVQLSCIIRLSDLSGMWTPGAKTMHGSGQAVVDIYRRAG